MANCFSGKIVEIGDAENVGKAKPFFKRVFVVDDSTNPKYPNPVPFELTGDDTSLIDGYSVGDSVTVKFYLRGRKWLDKKSGKDRYFLSAKVDEISGEGEEAPEGEEEAPVEPSAEPSADDLPF